MTKTPGGSSPASPVHTGLEDAFGAQPLQRRQLGLAAEAAAGDGPRGAGEVKGAEARDRRLG